MVSGSAVEMETTSYQLGEEVVAVRLEREGEVVRMTIADRAYEVSVIHSRAGEVTFKVAGIIHTAFVADDGSTRYVAIAGNVFELKKPDVHRVRRAQHQGEDNLTASMPGQIT